MEDEEKRTSFRKGIEILVNELSMENDSNTPDYVISEFLLECYQTFVASVNAREKYHGRMEF